MSQDAVKITDSEASAERDKAAAKTAATLARQEHEKVNAENQLLRKKLADAHTKIQDSTVIRPVASPAKIRSRHYGLLLSFVFAVLVPIGLSAAYLYLQAKDQYASTLAFTVRSEDISSSAADLLGGISMGLAGGGSTSSDANILYEYMRSPDLVRRVNDQLDLRTIYSRFAKQDPVFSLTSDSTIEDLTNYWGKMVKVSYDTGSGLMEVRALAFSPEDARGIAEALFTESSSMINGLSDIARTDATRYASEDLDIALERLKTAREAVTQFRLVNEIVDVQADIQSQMGLLSVLQGKQTEALIELDLISDTARAGDPRLEQAQRRLSVIEERIAEERRKFGSGGSGPNGVSYANTVAEYERLAVDREFAERAYVGALSAFDTAKAEANRQSRYLAAYITPTLAEQAEYPQREKILSLIGVFALLIWVISSLVFYALRERR